MEWDRNLLKENGKIEAAIEQYERQTGKDNLVGVLKAIQERLQEDGEFLFPVYRGQEGIISFRTVDVRNGGCWGVAFTSQEESEKNEPTEVIPFSIGDCLRANLDSDTEGLVINPWGTSFLLKKELIRLIIEEEEKDTIPDVEITDELLEDGSFLNRAVQSYKRCQSRKNLGKLVDILRACPVWVPCRPLLGDLDQENLEKMVRNAQKGDGLDALAGETFYTQEEVRMVPSLLQGGEHLFFPVFSSEEEAGKEEQGLSMVRCPFLHAAKMALDTEDVEGIVFNAFTVSFVFPSSFLAALVNMGPET